MPTPYSRKNFALRAVVAVSLLEWEDRICAVAVVGGCNWRCPYCHGWRCIADGAGKVDPDDFFRNLEKQAGWVDGVVFSGGEPTLQPGLEDMARQAKGLNLQVKVHTNGSRPEVLSRLLGEGLLDCLCLDYKAPLDERLAALAEASTEDLEAVRESFCLAASCGIEREYRTTLCPGFIDTGTFEEMAGSLESGGTWFLQQYEPGDCLDPARAGKRRFTLEELGDFEKAAGRKHPRVILRPGRFAP